MPFYRSLLSLRALALGALVASASCAEGGDTSGGATLDCGDSGAPALEVGTGLLGFLPIDPSGVPMVYGPQGGYHVWVSARAHGLGPRVLVRYGVHDTMSGDLLSRAGLQQRLKLTANAAGDDAVGLVCFLDGKDPLENVGHEVVVWAAIEDACH